MSDDSWVKVWLFVMFFVAGFAGFAVGKVHKVFAGTAANEEEIVMLPCDYRLVSVGGDRWGPAWLARPANFGESASPITWTWGSQNRPPHVYKLVESVCRS